MFALAAGVALASGCANGNGFGSGVVSTQPPGDDCQCCGPSNGTGSSNGGCGDDVAAAPHPSFGPTVTAETPPPPISGGTLLVTSDGKTAIAADSDRDLVHVVDIGAQKVTFHVALQPGDEPGRVIEDGAGRIHVALRGGGAIVSIDPTQGAILERRSVCPAPRGLAWDEATDTVLVACATGELVSLPAAGGVATRTVVVERDLRDVIDQAGVITVTRFRSAEVLRLAPDGSIAARFTPPKDVMGVPHVAWRAIPAAGGGILVAHQVESEQSVDVQTPHGYGGGGGGGGPSIVESVVTQLDGSGNVVQTHRGLFEVVLPVDVAVSPGGRWAVASPGTAYLPEFGTVAFADSMSAQPTGLLPPAVGMGQAVAVAFAGDSLLIVQSRQPAQLWILALSDVGSPNTSTVQLSSVSREDTGHDIFHVQAGAALACASCHPEGGDDGHVWTLSGEARRTPSLRGTIAGTAPYHWPGDQADVPTLVGEVYTQRMSGMQLDSGQMAALQHWVEAIPAPPAPSWVDAASAQRGQAIFSGAQAGCGGCHFGPKLTNNATLDVGTGGAFQVPPLVGVGWRTPLLHDGCAGTIADRFGTCSTSSHGNISALSAQDLLDLGNYLETL